MNTRLSLLLIILLFVSTNGNAQINDSIVGKWKFQELYRTEKMDSTSIQMLQQMFSDLTIYLKGNGQYKSMFMKKDEGSYQYDKASKKLRLTSNKGTTSEVELKILTGATLLMSFGQDKSIVLSRTTPDAADEAAEQPRKMALVPITPQQLCKKWYLSKRYLPNKTEEELKRVTDLFKGTYYDFKADNTYLVKLGTITETGKWMLTNDNKTLQLTSGGETKTWNIQQVAANELQLIRGNTAEYWTFSTQE